jgi:hypothetical protein
MQNNPMLGQGGAGFHGTGEGSAQAMLRELQSLRVSVVAGGGANSKRDFADIRNSDTIVSALNNNSGAITDITSTMSIDDLRARGTVTLTTVNAGDTVTVNGVTYTADTDFGIGANVTETAWSLARAIHYHESVNARKVNAWNVAGVVHVYARDEGVAGNAITLARVGAGIAVSAATLASGSDTGGIRSTGATNSIILFWQKNPLR